MVAINSYILNRCLARAKIRLAKEWGIRPQWVSFPDYEDAIDKANKKSMEVIRQLKL